MYQEYDKVSDTLMYLGSRFSVKFNVQLSTKDKYGNRKFFYSEYKYQSKYTDYGNVVSVKRNIKCFLSIEEVGNFQNNVLILRGDMPLLRANVTTAAKWLQDKAIFDINKGGQLAIMKDVSCRMQVGENAALMFEPVIIPLANGTSQQGIRVYISDIKNFVDVDARNFMEFYELIHNLDMYTAACAVISALPMTHEDAEVNRSDFESSAAEQRANYHKKPGFFDK